jgi:hypothetical protein
MSKARFEVVAGSRTNPGAVLAVFPVAASYKCGGAATAALRWFDAHESVSRPMFFRRVAR